MERFLKYMQHFKFYKSSQATSRFRHKFNGFAQQKRSKSNHLRLMAFNNIGDSKNFEVTKFDDLNTISQKMHSLKSAKVDFAIIQSGVQQNKDSRLIKWREKKQGMAQWKSNIAKIQELLKQDQNLINKFKWYNKRLKLTQWRSKPKVAQKSNSPSASTATEPLEEASTSVQIPNKRIIGGPSKFLKEQKKFEASKVEKVMKLSSKSAQAGPSGKPNAYKVTVVVKSASSQQNAKEATAEPFAIPEPPKPEESGIMKFSRLPNELRKSLTCFIPFLSDQGVSCAASHPPIYSLTPGYKHMQPLLGQAALAGVSSPFTSFEKSERVSMKSLQSYWENVFHKKNFSSRNADAYLTQSAAASEINASEVKHAEEESSSKSRVIYSDATESESKPKEKVKTRIFRRVGSSWKSIPKNDDQAETPEQNKKEVFKYTYSSEEKPLVDDSTLGIAHFTAVIPNPKNKAVSTEFTQLRYTFPAKLRKKSYKLKMQKPNATKPDGASVPKDVNKSMVDAGNPKQSKNPNQNEIITLGQASKLGLSSANLPSASTPDSNVDTLGTALGENESAVSTGGGDEKPNRNKTKREEQEIALKLEINKSDLPMESNPNSNALTVAENESTVSKAVSTEKSNQSKTTNEEQRSVLKKASEFGINNSPSMEDRPNILTYPLPTTLDENVVPPPLPKKKQYYTNNVFKTSSKKKLQKNEDKMNSISLPPGEQLNQECKTLHSNSIAEYVSKKKLQKLKANLDLRYLENFRSDLKLLLHNPFLNTVNLTNIIKERLGYKLDSLINKTVVPPIENSNINGKKQTDGAVNKVTDSNISIAENQEITNQSNTAVPSSSSTVEHIQLSNTLESKDQPPITIKEDQNHESSDQARTIEDSNSSATEKDSNELESKIESEMVQSNVANLMPENCGPKATSGSGKEPPDTSTPPSAPRINARSGPNCTIPQEMDVYMTTSKGSSTCCSGNSRTPPLSSSDCNVSPRCPPRGDSHVPPKCPPRSHPCGGPPTRDPPKSSTCCTVNAKKGGGGPCIPARRPSPMWEFFSSSEFWVRNAGFINLLLLLLAIFGIRRSFAKPTLQDLEIEEQERKNAEDKQKYERKCRKKDLKGCIEEKKKLKEQRAAKIPPKIVKKEAKTEPKKDVKKKGCSDESKKDGKTEIKKEVKKKGGTTAEKCEM